MSEPVGFSWVDKPVLAGMARPSSEEDFEWLRDQGIQLIVSLTEDPPPRAWINNVGLFSMHVPIEDFHAPTQRQIDLVVSALQKAQQQRMGAAVHCRAGLGRTGAMLACYFVHQGLTAQSAIAKVRSLRPGSIETEEQVQAIHEYARRLHNKRDAD